MAMLSIFSISTPFQTRELFQRDLEQSLDNNIPCSVTTLNPEILLRAKKEEQFFRVVNAATHRVVDGFGIALVVWLRTSKRLSRITGRQVIATVCEYARKRHLRVGCFGGGIGVAKKASSALANVYPGLEVLDVAEGSYVPVDRSGKILLSMAHRIETFIRDHQIAVLLVGLGAPKQEYCIQALQRVCPSIRVAVGVGGLLDIFAGTLPEPPHWLRSIGCEWLWRVMHQPSRILRILRATVVFPFLAFPSLHVYDK